MNFQKNTQKSEGNGNKMNNELTQEQLAVIYQTTPENFLTRDFFTGGLPRKISHVRFFHGEAPRKKRLRPYCPPRRWKYSRMSSQVLKVSLPKGMEVAMASVVSADSMR